jgi:hypothetical protein
LTPRNFQAEPRYRQLVFAVVKLRRKLLLRSARYSFGPRRPPLAICVQPGLQKYPRSKKGDTPKSPLALLWAMLLRRSILGLVWRTSDRTPEGPVGAVQS